MLERDGVNGEDRCDNEGAKAPQRARADADRFGNTPSFFGRTKQIPAVACAVITIAGLTAAGSARAAHP
jgi:hypothetical protein